MSDFDQAAVAAGPDGGPPNLEPTRIKVFGVMHIVFGSLGVLQVLGSLVMMPFQRKIMEMSSKGGPDGMVEMQMEIVEKLTPYTWISLVIGLTVAGFILRAGIMLVKKKPGAVAASTQYSWVSISAKVVLLVLVFLFVLPVYNDMFDQLTDMGGPGAKEMLMVMKISAAAGGILGPVLMAIYPIVALVMLKKSTVKDYFDRLSQ